jgi:conjugal transfer pilus assembly protein TraV
MKIIRIFILTLPIGLLGACSTSQNFTCLTPETKCQSISETHTKWQNGELKEYSVKPDELTSDEDDEENSPGYEKTLKINTSTTSLATVKPGKPILSSPRTLRGWVKPFVDADNDYHDETFITIRLDNGVWIKDE